MKNARRPRLFYSSSIIHHSTFRSAFTLAELLVSLVILIAMMTMIAMIFSTAGKSSGIAQAQTKLHRHLQQVSATIDDDLAKTYYGPETSGAPKGVLAIVGATVWSQDKAQSPYGPHRADVLMLLTQQNFEPFVYEPPTGAMFEQLKQVVYGHADIGKIDPATGAWMGTTRRIESTVLPAVSGMPASDMMASEYHLARRVVGFWKSGVVDFSAGAATGTLVSPAFLGSAASVADAWSTSPPAVRFSDVLASMTPGFYAYTRGGPNMLQLAECYVETSVGGVDHKGRMAGGWYLLEENRNDSPPGPAYWWSYRGLVLGVPTWRRIRPDGSEAIYQPLPHVQPPLLPTTGYMARPAAPAPNFFYWPDWFYAPDNPDTARTRIDPMPPAGAGMAKRMNSYFLPSCAEFKVEFTYDDPREVAIGDASWNYQPIRTDTNGDGVINDFDAPAPRPINWQTVPPGAMYVWTGLSVTPNAYPDLSSVPPVRTDVRNRTLMYRWPRALRITIRAYAPGGALDYPVEQTLVHVWK